MLCQNGTMATDRTRSKKRHSAANGSSAIFLGMAKTLFSLLKEKQAKP